MAETETDKELAVATEERATHERGAEAESAEKKHAVADEPSAAGKTAVRKQRKRLICSIPRRTMVNYFLYSVILLVVLWSIFLIGMSWYYDTMLTRDMDDARRAAVSAFPRRGDDNSMIMFYKLRLTEIARSNSCAIVVFRQENGTNDIEMMSDGMGNTTDDESDVFDAVMACADFGTLFGGGKDVVKVGTGMGTFICAGSRHIVETTGGELTLYMLLLKPYEVINAQTLKIIYVLIACTLILLVFACLFAYIASRYQTNRLTDFTQKAKRLADGDYGVEFSGYGYNEYEILAGALNDATDKLKRAEKLQRDIVANVSHDIRTPLTMIRAYAEMLRDMPFDEKKRKATADVIISESDRLTALVADVLNYSKLQAGVAEFKFEPNDISLIAVQVLKRFDLYRERDGIDFIADIDKKATVNCDKTRIEQLLYNLLNNAYNYCGEDKKILLSLKKTDGKVRVEVTDHGIGIEKDELDSVWDRYYRTAHAQRSAAGSGLGLSICKNILIAHKAEFGVISEVGSGTTFWFELETVKSK